MKKLITLAIFTLVIFLVAKISPALAITCDDPIPSSENDLIAYRDDCTKRANQLSGQARTLASAITYLNTQIKLTQAKIATTTIQLDKLNVEIEDLSGRIESIDYSLDDLTKLFISRVRETYMRPNQYDTAIIAQSSGLSGILRNIEYTKKIRDHDRSILVALEKSRLDFNAQKELKETKQAEIASLKSKLDAEKSTLNSQISSKNQLLSQTKNDEARYQSLRSQANQQLQKFQSFVNSHGGSSILSNQTKCNEGWEGCYYNQRDSLWGNMNLGSTGYLMKDSGCFATSVAMLASHFGKNIKPNDIASSPDTISPAGDVVHSFSVNGVNVTINNVSKSSLDSELSAGRYMMAELNYGAHFIVILRKEGDSYIMNDPFLPDGYNKPLSAGGYSNGSITSLRSVSFN